MKPDPDDWRRMGQERYLKGVILVRRKYRRNPGNPGWDHDHCEFCGVKFMEEEHPDALNKGYTTVDDYRWICERCFTDFSEEFNWRVKSARSA